jgi:ClpP class serine protease
MNKLLEALLMDRWVIAESWADKLLAIAESSVDIEALEKRMGKYMDGGETVSIRDGVATIPVKGPIFARQTFFAWLIDAPSYDVLARDLEAALSNPEVDSIMLDIDSPGGQVTGVSEFWNHIRAGQSRKPIDAYVGGEAQSAGYWIASAARNIYGADTSLFGSIGAQLGVRVVEARAGEKTYRFVSSVSPMKNADPGTEAGAAELQSIADGIGDVFIAAVAQGRGKSKEVVVESFGKGGSFIAAEALKRGMIDGISTYETVLQSLRQGIDTMELEKATAADLAAKRPDLAEAIRAEALAGVQSVDQEKLRAEAAGAERERMTAIDALAVEGAEEIVAACKADGSTADQAAMKILQHVKAKGAQQNADALQALKDAEAKAKAVGTVATDDKDKPADPIGAVLADAQAAGVIIS